jgi:TrmH family RNA methyltransferase
VGAETSYARVDLTGPTAIALGSEAGGLSAAWDSPEITLVSIPMNGWADSLNVSVAAAIVLYEAVRQRDQIERDRGH